MIGFLIFLALTVFTAVMIPSDGSPSILHSCLVPPLLRDGLKNSALSAKDILSPLSGWKLPQILMNCLPKKFHREDNLTDSCILVIFKYPIFVKPCLIVIVPNYLRQTVETLIFMNH